MAALDTFLQPSFQVVPHLLHIEGVHTDAFHVEAGVALNDVLDLGAISIKAESRWSSWIGRKQSSSHILPVGVHPKPESGPTCYRP